MAHIRKDTDSSRIRPLNGRVKTMHLEDTSEEFLDHQQSASPQQNTMPVITAITSIHAMKTRPKDNPKEAFDNEMNCHKRARSRLEYY